MTSNATRNPAAEPTGRVDEILVRLAILVAAIALTYVCCVRPMRRREGTTTSRAVDLSEDAERQSYIARLRADIAQARRDLEGESPPPQDLRAREATRAGAAARPRS